MNLYSFLNVLSYPIAICIMIIVLHIRGSEYGLKCKDILPLFITITLIVVICTLYMFVAIL